jgi:SAM-dependent methyltransferase
VLKANPTCRVTGCDISPTALRLLRRAAEQAGVDASRIRTLLLDAALPDGGADVRGDDRRGAPDAVSVPNGSYYAAPAGAGASPLAGLGADSVLLVFTLSALPPEAHGAALAHAAAALRPGGLLLFR